MLFDQSDIGKRVPSLFKERLHSIREILDTFPDRQENAQAKKDAMNKLESLEWIVEKEFVSHLCLCIILPHLLVL